MKKCLIAAVLTMSLLVLPAFAATTVQQNTADALNSMGLFLGTGEGYELDRPLQRSESITLLVRLLGKDAAAQNGNYAHPFDDVADWLKPYVSYAYENGLTKGVSDKSFGSAVEMDRAQYLTMVLRALGYTDGGEDPDFTWDKPFALAKEVGLVANETATVTRGDAVEIFWKALSATPKGESKAFVKALIADGAFTQSAYDAAAKIQKNGKTTTPTSGGSVGGGSSKPSGGSSSGGSSSGGSSSGSATTNPGAGVSYADYMEMSGTEQGAFQKEFKNTDAFFAWLKDAMAQHKENDAEIGDGGTIDLDKLG